MFEAKVYRIAVTSLGAILVEEHIAKETIQAWNCRRGESAGKLYLTQSLGCPAIPDMYVVIIDSYLDIAKVDAILANDRSMVFFFSQYHDPKNSIQTEIDSIATFREKMRTNYTCVDYRTAHEFGEVLSAQLDTLL